jgi:hypothetical protein
MLNRNSPSVLHKSISLEFDNILLGDDDTLFDTPMLNK